MAYTVPALVAAHQALLDLLIDGSTGTATIDLYAGATLVASMPIDHVTCEVNATTGQLVLAPDPDGTLGLDSGTVTVAQLVARDGTVLEDAWPVQQGASAVAGMVVMPSLVVVEGGQVDLISATS